MEGAGVLPAAVVMVVSEIKAAVLVGSVCFLGDVLVEIRASAVPCVVALGIVAVSGAVVVVEAVAAVAHVGYC